MPAPARLHCSPTQAWRTSHDSRCAPLPSTSANRSEASWPSRKDRYIICKRIIILFTHFVSKYLSAKYWQGVNMNGAQPTDELKPRLPAGYSSERFSRNCIHMHLSYGRRGRATPPWHGRVSVDLLSMFGNKILRMGELLGTRSPPRAGLTDH